MPNEKSYIAITFPSLRASLDSGELIRNSSGQRYPKYPKAHAKITKLNVPHYVDN